MARSFEEQYADVLQNIEFAIVETDRRLPGTLDYHVDAALEAAISVYTAEQLGRTPREVVLEGHRREMYDAVRKMCEWRLGRGRLDDEEGEASGPPTPSGVDEIAACLKRVRKSVQRWNKQGGRRGYLQFVSRYLG
jgi:hypothetical protein